MLVMAIDGMIAINAALSINVIYQNCLLLLQQAFISLPMIIFNQSSYISYMGTFHHIIDNSVSHYIILQHFPWIFHLGLRLMTKWIFIY